jgi:hypothetical protein
MYQGNSEPKIFAKLENVLQSQLYVCHDQDDRWEPFTRLRIAVLIDALRSFQRNVDSRVTRTPNESAKAERWIFTASEDGPFSFESICHSVKIHPSYLRRALLEWRSNRLAGLRVQTPVRRAPVANPRGRVGKAAAKIQAVSAHWHRSG